MDFLLDRGLVHNLVSIIPNYNLYNLQKVEDDLDHFGLQVLTLTLFPTSLGGFSPASLLKLLNPDTLKHNLDYMYAYVYIIYAFVKLLDEPSIIIICLSCHPGGPLHDGVIEYFLKIYTKFLLHATKQAFDVPI